MQQEVVFNVFMIAQKPIMSTPEWLYLAWRRINDLSRCPVQSMSVVDIQYTKLSANTYSDVLY